MWARVFPRLSAACTCARKRYSRARSKARKALCKTCLPPEAHILGARPPRDIDEVVSYVRAMNHRLARLSKLPVSVRLIREIRAELLKTSADLNYTAGAPLQPKLDRPRSLDPGRSYLRAASGHRSARRSQRAFEVRPQRHPAASGHLDLRIDSVCKSARGNAVEFECGPRFQVREISGGAQSICAIAFLALVVGVRSFGALRQTPSRPLDERIRVPLTWYRIPTLPNLGRRPHPSR